MSDHWNRPKIENIDCPACGSKNIKHGGHIRGDKAYICGDCGKKFTRQQRYDSHLTTRPEGRLKGVGLSM